MNDQLDAVVLLLESMTLSPEQAARVNSAIHVGEITISVGTSTRAAMPETAALSRSDPVPVDDNNVPDLLLTPSSTPIPPVDQAVNLNHDGRADPPTVQVADVPAITLRDAATTHRHLPVEVIKTNGEVRFQHTYKSIAFDIPRADSAGPFYLVTRGTRIGIFSTWSHTSPYVIGISCATFRRVQTLDNGLLSMLAAIDAGTVQLME